MIQFNEQELSQIEDELYEALSHLEEAPDYEAEGSVNLLRVGQKNGQAIQIIRHVNNLLGDKLQQAKAKKLSERPTDVRREINDNIHQALKRHRSMFVRGHSESPWDENLEEGMQHGSRD